MRGKTAHREIARQAKRALPTIARLDVEPARLDRRKVE
jgi:hypothetical protein